MNNVSKRSESVTIYTLTSPENNQVFYVGQTRLPIHQRLIDHKTSNSPVSAYFKKLRAKNLEPVAEEIDTCSVSNAFALEAYWIQQFAAWGFDLLNKQRCYRVYPANKNLQLSLTAEEKRLIGSMYRIGDCQTLTSRTGRYVGRVRPYADEKSKWMPSWLKDAAIMLYRDRLKSLPTIKS